MRKMCRTRFQKFLKQRSRTHNHIREFLWMVLKYCSKMIKAPNHGNLRNVDIYAAKLRERLPELLKSLCFIHALYGYPPANSDVNPANSDVHPANSDVDPTNSDVDPANSGVNPANSDETGKS